VNEAPSAFAAEPFTPRGVAAFACARWRRLVIFQIIIAFIAAATTVWFVHDSCFPVIQTAIRNLPATGEIRSGRLSSETVSPQLLAEERFLAVDMDLTHSGQIHSTADVQIEFGHESVRIFSWLGYLEFWYPADFSFPFNRPELEPRWGAWTVEILFAGFFIVVFSLLASWWLLATLYALPVWVFGYFANRALNLRQSWRLAGAALLPGALLMTAGILLYDFGLIDLVGFCFVFGAHFILGWIYLCVSLLFVPRIADGKAKGNPFEPRK